MMQKSSTMSNYYKIRVSLHSAQAPIPHWGYSTREDDVLVKSEQARSGLGSDCEGLSFIVNVRARGLVPFSLF